VNYIITKQAPIRLEAERYRELRKQVLRRDGWRCQLCGSMTNLESITNNFAATPVGIKKGISSRCVLIAIFQRMSRLLARMLDWRFRQVKQTFGDPSSVRLSDKQQRNREYCRLRHVAFP
jgi:hypothetical protein